MSTDPWEAAAPRLAAYLRAHGLNRDEDVLAVMQRAIAEARRRNPQAPAADAPLHALREAQRLLAAAPPSKVPSEAEQPEEERLLPPAAPRSMPAQTLDLWSPADSVGETLARRPWLHRLSATASLLLALVTTR